MLELSHLGCRYGDVIALDDVSFSVAPGQIMGFVGRNGAGKTTAMRTILGLVEPDAGEVRWHGEFPSARVRSQDIGYLPEERGLYPKMRIIDQLVFFGRASAMTTADATAAAEHWLERLGLGDRARDTLDALSLGNQQRVQLAAAILHQPDLLVLDEPFSGLDPIGVDVMADAIAEEVDRGAAVLFSSHQLDLVERVCDAVTIIEAGRVTASGTVDELRRAGGQRRYEIEVEGPPDPEWIDALTGVDLVETDGTTLLVLLSPEADDQELLDAARQAGTVRRFGRQRRTLADRYRETITP